MCIRHRPERMDHRLADQPRLLLALDDLELDAGLVVEPVEQHVAVARVADRAGTDCAIHRHAVMVEALAEVHERLDRLVHDVVVELAARERTCLLYTSDAADERSSV